MLVMLENIDINNYDIVSFDVFDTLVKRLFKEPRDIFDVVELKYNYTHCKKISNFRDARVKAEAKAREISEAQDVTLCEIYKYIDFEHAEELKQLEIATEIEAVVPNKRIIEFYNKCIENNKEIIIVSDMYLPRSVICEMLSKVGVPKNSYAKLYLSCDVGLTKLTGDLFAYVVNDLGINPARMIHIGDNAKNDIEHAIKNGINTFHVVNENDSEINYWKVNSESTIELTHLDSLLHNIKDISAAESLGYSLIGPITYCYSMWLHKKRIEEQVDCLVFLSREGYFLKKVYDYIFSDEKTFYGEINRNTLFYPLMYVDPSIDGFFKNMPLKHSRYKIKDLLYYFNADNELIGSYIKEHNIDINNDYTENELKNNNSFVELYQNIVKSMRPSFKKQYDLLVKYISKFTNYKKIGIVNNSMSGTAQRELNIIIKYANLDIDLFGLHFIRRKELEKSNIKGTAWFDKSCGQIYKNLFYKTCIIFESCLFPGEGTCLSYKHNGNQVICEKEDDKYSVSNYLLFSKVQSGAMVFCEYYKEHIPLYIEAKVCLDAWIRFISYPCLEHAEIFTEIMDYEEGRVRSFVSRQRTIELAEEDWWPQGSLSLAEKKIDLMFYNTKLRVKYLKNLIKPNWE